MVPSDYIPTTLLSTYRSHARRFASSLRRGVSGDDPAGGAGSGPVSRSANRSLGRFGTPSAKPHGLVAGKALIWIRRHCRRWQHGFRGRKSPRWSAEGRRPGRNGMRRVSLMRLSRLASATRRPVRASRRSAHPSLGVGTRKGHHPRAKAPRTTKGAVENGRAQGHEQAATHRWRHIDDVAGKPGRSERRRLMARSGCRASPSPAT